MILRGKWLVLGGGISGQSAAKYLAAAGASVTVSDTKSPDEKICADLKNHSVDLLIGPQTPDMLANFAGIIVSPGVPQSAPILSAARAQKIQLATEIDLALHDYRGKVVSITGTNGKSTTTLMAEHLLRKLGVNARACGNIGIPATALTAPGVARPDVLVLEISSYQLEQSQNFRSHAAAFTSFSHDHIGRHGTHENYFKTKWKLFAAMRADDLIVVTPEIHAIARSLGCKMPSSRVLEVGTPTADAATNLVRHGIVEPHNQRNALFAAYMVSHVTDTKVDELLPLFADFRGLPYRFQRVGQHNGQVIINDSKSTNVESVLVALSSVPTPCTLILGGQSKNEPFQTIADQFKDRLHRVLICGASGPEIYEQLKRHLPCIIFPTLKSLLQHLQENRELISGPLVFSPGCASFDEFDNFEDRGAFFNEHIRPLMDG